MNKEKCNLCKWINSCTCQLCKNKEKTLYDNIGNNTKGTYSKID